VTVLTEFKRLANGSLSLDEFKSSVVQFNQHSLIETFDYLVEYKLLWKVVDCDSKGAETSLVDLLFEVVYPEIADGVVLPVGFQQSMSIFSNSTVSCGKDADCVRMVYVSLLDYVELYFGTGYRNAMKIKQYQKNQALVEGHEAVANLRVGEVVGYPQTLPEVVPLQRLDELESGED
jgi:hypothetical protein